MFLFHILTNGICARTQFKLRSGHKTCVVCRSVHRTLEAETWDIDSRARIPRILKTQIMGFNLLMKIGGQTMELKMLDANDLGLVLITDI